jgi:hypothetical protein
MSASWCELFRHFTIDGVDPFEVRRRAGRCRTNALSVLDLTDQHVCEALDVDEQDLVGDDYQRCQLLADAAHAAGLDGVLSPSAGLPGQQTLVVFTGPLDSGRVIIETERVQVPPISVVKLLPRVRAVPAVAAAFEAYAGDLARRPYAAVRRRYRGR